MSNKNSLTSLLLIPMIFISTSFSAAAFSDVKEGNSYYVSISNLENDGIIQGYEDGTFKPGSDVSRAEALKMIGLASGAITNSGISNMEELESRPFEDVVLSAWFAKYISLAKEKGLIDGYPDGTFKPKETINLAESLKIFLEAVNFELNEDEIPYLLTIDDVQAEDWFASYAAYAISKGIINIYPSNTINAHQTMTRGYLAEIIYRHKMAKQGYDFGKATFYGAAVQGSGTASGETFDLNSFTAAHKTLPFGTIIEVTNLANGKSVEVKINDRGPYGPGRVLDLSSSAFSEIASLGAGVINVQYVVK